MTSSEGPQSMHSSLGSISEKLIGLNNLNNNGSCQHSVSNSVTLVGSYNGGNSSSISSNNNNSSSPTSLTCGNSTLGGSSTSHPPLRSSSTPSPNSTGNNSVPELGSDSSLSGLSVREENQLNGGVERDTTGGGLKITENHLSTKLVRNSSAPYSIPTRSSHNRQQPGNQPINGGSSDVHDPELIGSLPGELSSLARGNSSVSKNISCDVGGCDDAPDSDDNNMVQSEQTQLEEFQSIDNSTPTNPRGIGGPADLSGTELTPNSISSGDNQNNSSYLSNAPSVPSNPTLTFSQSAIHLHQTHALLLQQQQQQSIFSSTAATHPNINHSSGSACSASSDLHEDSEDGSFLTSSPGNHMGIIEDNSIMPGGANNGMTTPGGASLDEHDCDSKMMNGDNFGSEDMPDPDAIKMFVGQIPKNLSEAELRALFEEYGPVYQINVLRDKGTKQSKGCCFVTFYTRKAALEAQNALHNVKTLSGMNHPIQMKPADNENRYERKLFVGMISKKFSEPDVRNMFSRFGIIDECTVLRDSNQQSRGCAFVTFASKQCAQSAIKHVHQSTTMEGCSSPIVVKFADTQKDKDQKRQQQIQANMMTNLSTTAAPSPVAPHYFSLLNQLQQQQQQQQPNYFSQMGQLAVQASGLGNLNSGSGLTGLTGLGSSHGVSSSDLATLAALANLTGVAGSNQHSLSLGVQNLVALSSQLGSQTAISALSPSGQPNCDTSMQLGLGDYFGITGANGTSLGSTNSVANLTGLNSFAMTMRSPATKQPLNQQVEGPEGANLFIYHLPPECDDQQLASMFSGFGNVISAKVFIDKQTNLSKCFGFVSYDNVLSAQMAISTMNGFQVGMKRLKVQHKRSKEAAKPY